MSNSEKISAVRVRLSEKVQELKTFVAANTPSDLDAARERFEEFEKAIVSIKDFEELKSVFDKYDETERRYFEAREEIGRLERTIVSELVFIPKDIDFAIAVGKEIVSPAGIHPDERVFAIV